MPPDTKHPVRTSDAFVYHVSEVTAWIGVVCYLLLFALAIRVPRLRQHPESLVLFIAFCGTMFNLRGIVRDTIWDASDHGKARKSHNSFLFIDDGCYLETIWGHFWLWSSMIWCFLWVFDYTIRLRNPLASVASRRKRFHIATWSFAVLLVGILVSTGKIGEQMDGTCSIAATSLVNLLVLVPLLVFTSVTVFTLVWAVRLRLDGLSESVRARTILKHRHIVYGSAYLACWLFEIVYILCLLAEAMDNMSTFDGVHVAILHLQGVILLAARLGDRSVRAVLSPVPTQDSNDSLNAPLLVSVLSLSDLTAGMDDKQDLPLPASFGNLRSVSQFSINGTSSVDAQSDVSFPCAGQQTSRVVSTLRLGPSVQLEFANFSAHHGSDSGSSLDLPAIPRSRDVTRGSYCPPALDSVGPPLLVTEDGELFVTGAPVPLASPAVMSPHSTSSKPRRTSALRPELTLQQEIGMCLVSGMLDAIRRDEDAYGRVDLFSPLSLSRRARSFRASAVSVCTIDDELEEDSGHLHPPCKSLKRAASMRVGDTIAVPSPRPTVASMGTSCRLLTRESSSPFHVVSPPSKPPSVSHWSDSQSTPVAPSTASFDSVSRKETLTLRLDSQPAAAGNVLLASPVAEPGSQQKFEFTTLLPHGFHHIRSLCQQSYDRISTELSPSGLLNGDLAMTVSAAGSDSFFILSHSFVVKTISSDEVSSLMRMLDGYVGYMSDHPDTRISRIIGCFAVKIPSVDKVYAILQENVNASVPFPRGLSSTPLPGFGEPQLFDLKGSTVDREASPGAKILKDIDFRRLHPTGLTVAHTHGSLTSLLVTIQEDVEFLRAQGIMDYSLLVGIVDPEAPPTHPSPVVIGIIDYLQVGPLVVFAVCPGLPAIAMCSSRAQRFDMKKKWERNLKGMLKLSMDLDISAIEPDAYAKRFLAFVKDVFTCSPAPSP